MGLWTPGSQGSPAGQRGRGGAGMQRVGSGLRHLIPACPAAVLLAASPSAPQSQPRGSIEGTGRGKGILSGKPVGQIVQMSLLSLLTRLCTDPQVLPCHIDRKPRRIHTTLTQLWHLPLHPASAGLHQPGPPSALPGVPQHLVPLFKVSLHLSALPALSQSLQGGKEIPTLVPRDPGDLPSSLDP